MTSPKLICAGVGLNPYLSAGISSAAATKLRAARLALSRKASATGAYWAAARAAYAVSYTQLFSFVTWTSIGLMGAAAAVAGQNLGAGRPDRTAAAVHVAARIGVGVAIFVGILFLWIPRQLLAIFGLQEPAVVSIATGLLRVLSLSGLFVAAALTYTGGLQGTGDTKSPLYISIASQVVLPLGICFAIQQTGTLQPIHIWLAILAGHVTRFTLSYLRFAQGRWRGIRVDMGRSRETAAGEA